MKRRKRKSAGGPKAKKAKGVSTTRQAVKRKSSTAETGLQDSSESKKTKSETAPESESPAAIMSPGRRLAVDPNCLLHAGKWACLLQFALNRLTVRKKMPSKYGRLFGKAVCSCDGGAKKADVSKTFNDPTEVKRKAREVRTHLSAWMETAIVLKPLFDLLDSWSQTSYNPSLVRFIYYFSECYAGNYTCLDALNSTETESEPAASSTSANEVPASSMSANGKLVTTDSASPLQVKTDSTQTTGLTAVVQPVQTVSMETSPSPPVKPLVIPTQQKPETGTDRGINAVTPMTETSTEMTQQVMTTTSTQSKQDTSESSTQSRQETQETGTQAQPDSNKCMVHHRKWMSTYQFSLNQMHIHLCVPRKDSRPLSKAICSCTDKPELTEFYTDEAEAKSKFDEVQNTLKTWKEGDLVLRPLLREIAKFEKAETFRSLIKFVYYLIEYKNGEMDCLNPNKRRRVATAVGAASGSAGVPAAQAEAAKPPATTTVYSLFGPSSGAIPKTTVAGSSSMMAKIAPGASISVRTSGVMETQLPPSKPSAPVVPAEPPKPKYDVPSEKITNTICLLHDHRWRAVFQCVINHLVKKEALPPKYNRSFSTKVCSCKNKKFAYEDYFTSEEEAKKAARTVKTKLAGWHDQSQTQLKMMIGQVEQFIENGYTYESALKLFYYFQNACLKQYAVFE